MNSRKRMLIIAAIVVVVCAIGAAIALTAHGDEEGVNETPARQASDEETSSISASSTASVEPTSASMPSTRTADSTTPHVRPVAPPPSTTVPATASGSQKPPVGNTTDPAITYVGRITDVKKSLTIEQRKGVYYKLVQAEDRAIVEATEKYPMEVEDADYDAHYEMRFRLTDEYQTLVRKEYELTVDGMNAILTEGMENNWPLPVPPL